MSLILVLEKFSLSYHLYISGTFTLLSPVHFRHFRCFIAGTFSVRSLCYCQYIFGTLSVSLPVHFRFDPCFTACTFSVRSLCYCVYIFDKLCVTACTFSVRCLCYWLYIFGTLSVLLSVHFQFTYVTEQRREKSEAEEQ